MHARIIFVIVSILMLTSGCSERGASQRRVAFEIQNHTEHDLTDVTLTGEGFPGRFGYLVKTGSKSFGCSRMTVGANFTASWRIEGSEAVYERKLACPPDFVLNGENMLVVEFWPDNKVRVRTDPMPGPRRSK